MFPGDREERIYHVRVSYSGTVTVHFRADVRPGYEKLAEVLQCEVYLKSTGEILYDGLMKNMGSTPGHLDYPLTASSRDTANLEYVIAVYLDTSVGNDYQDKTLIADFRWWVEERGSDPGPTPTPTPTPSSEPGPGPIGPGGDVTPTKPPVEEVGIPMPELNRKDHFDYIQGVMTDWCIRWTLSPVRRSQRSITAF